MRLVELRDLDGPGIFMDAPAIKLELAIEPADLARHTLAALAARLEPLGVSDPDLDEADRPPLETLGAMLADALAVLHARAGMAAPETHWVPMETPGQHSLAFAWSRRRFARAAATLLADTALGACPDPHAEAARLPALLARSENDPDDRPLLIADAARHIPAVGITGTNGKTTTTRIIAHTLQLAGRHPGWSTTAGVFIDGEMVLEGDYSGPSGARRVLADPGVDIALLETARGGILLRGLACQSTDVSIMTNITADHLGLHGIHSVEGLAKAKSVVLRVTRPEGWAVLNADDPLVRGAASVTHAGRFWFTRDPENPHVRADLADGGRAVLAADGWIVEARGEHRERIVPIAEVPVTFGGRALHMVENALAAAAALRALGLSPQQIAAGLRDFGSDPAHNPGRNDLYRVRNGTVLVDYAHNEAGVSHMWDLARSFVQPGGKLTGIVGSAGDRTDEIIRSLGRIAAQKADEVLIKETQRYLRGRESNAPINQLFIEGIREGGKDPLTIIETEADAVRWAIDRMNPGDVVAVMCFEDPPGTRALVEELAG